MLSISLLLLGICPPASGDTAERADVIERVYLYDYITGECLGNYFMVYRRGVEFDIMPSAYVSGKWGSFSGRNGAYKLIVVNPEAPYRFRTIEAQTYHEVHTTPGQNARGGD